MQNWLEEIKRIIDSDYKIFRETFIFSFVSGIIIHIVIIASGLHNHDSIVLPYSDGSWLISQGKWFASPFTSIDGPLDIYYLSGIIGIAAYALSAAVIVVTLKVENKAVSKLIGLCLISCPSVGTGLIYHGADYFGGSFFVAVLASCLIIQEGIIPAVIGTSFLCLAIGAYQANVSVALTLLLVEVILSIVSKDSKVGTVIKKTIKYVGLTAVATILYYVVLKIVVAVKNIELSGYKGIDNMSSILNPKILFSSSLVAYSNFLKFFTHGAIGLYSGKRFWVGTMLIAIAVSIVIIYCSQVYKETNCLNRKTTIIKGVILAIYVFIGLPLCANSIGLLSQNTSFYYITVCAFSLAALVPSLVTDKMVEGFEETAKIGLIGKIFETIVLCTTLLLCFTWIKEENTVYQEFMIINKEYDFKFPTLVSDIQSVDGFSSESEIAIVGAPPYDFLESAGVLAAFENTFYTYGYGLGSGAGEIYNEGVLYSYLTNKYSININKVENGEILENYRGEIDEMPIYPNDGSIKNIDRWIVVKLSENY